MQVFPSDGRAEFLQTAPGVYQSVGKRAKAVVSVETPGLFIFYGPEVELQDFSARSLETGSGKPDDSYHFFLSFSAAENRYTRLIVPNGSFRIQGRLTVTFGPMRVTIDNSNPYCSIVVEEPGREPEVLGLFGLTEIANDQGSAAVALYEGEQLAEYRQVIAPYELRDSGLFVNSRPVDAPSIGLIIDVNNRCLTSDAAVITRRSFEILKAEKDKKRARELLLALLTKRKVRNPLSGWFRLRTNRHTVVAYDWSKKETYVIKAAPEIEAAEMVPDGIESLCVIDRPAAVQ